jgi:hypothetical protein
MLHSIFYYYECLLLVLLSWITACSTSESEPVDAESVRPDCNEPVPPPPPASASVTSASGDAHESLDIVRSNTVNEENKVEDDSDVRQTCI